VLVASALVALSGCAKKPAGATAQPGNDGSVIPAGTAHDAAPPASAQDLASAPVIDLGTPADLQPLTAAACLKSLLPATATTTYSIDYDQFHPAINADCSGTQHQHITGIEKVVYLGDSVTVGTPPTPLDQFYRVTLSSSLMTKFGAVESVNCAQLGATTVDLLGGMKEIPSCFPSGVEPKKTLIVMTMGSNNLQDWALQKPTVANAIVSADQAASEMRAAITWLKDPAHFPNGSYVLFGNAYEYTDGTGDLDSCPLATISNLSGNVGYLMPAISHLEEQFMKVAVDTNTDLMFMLEHFCGHGYHNTDPSAPCYRGPGIERWFDVSCLHPTPTGHGKIAGLFFDIASH
jgi:hypothetical protein